MLRGMSIYYEKNLDSLPLEVVYQIIDELDTDSRNCLLHVNKKWNRIIVNLPEHRKFTMKVSELTIRDNMLFIEYYVEREKANCSFSGFQNIFNLFSNISGCRIQIDIKTVIDEKKSCLLLTNYKQRFWFYGISINFQMEKLNFPEMWLEILSMFKSVQFNCSKGREVFLQDDVRQEFEKLILQSHNLRKVNGKFSRQFCIEFLKQIIEGLRPRFNELFVRHVEKSGNVLDALLSGITCEHKRAITVGGDDLIELPSLGYYLYILSCNSLLTVYRLNRLNGSVRIARYL